MVLDAKVLEDMEPDDDVDRDAYDGDGGDDDDYDGCLTQTMSSIRTSHPLDVATLYGVEETKASAPGCRLPANSSYSPEQPRALQQPREPRSRSN